MAGEKILILGAAGRDFQNFNTFFRDNEKYEVVGFTATQIPNIDDRSYPAVLAGKLYPKGLPIWPEEDLEKIVKEHGVERCILAYSDLNNQTVMELSARVNACGADFTLMGTKRTMIKSTKPVVAVCAVRTGCGKSQTSRYVAKLLRDAGLTPVAIRHPMPYGDLAKQKVQRFSKMSDMDLHDVTIEEREEYEMHVQSGTVVYAGVDFEAIIREAEKEADVIIWDGGNNDWPFYFTDLWITVADPLRLGHESQYYPGAVNFRSANIILINKANTAEKKSVDALVQRCKEVNPKATVVIGASEVTVDKPELVEGKRVVLIDDGPTLTHGEMPFGAGQVAADKYKVAECVDPRPFAKGSIKAVLDKWKHLGNTIPAMGYYEVQRKELEETINAIDCDTVLSATPMDLKGLIKIDKPVAVAGYELVDMEKPYLRDLVNDWIASIKK